nr:MAG TPA: hypothetical protein [Caudoviricetes sp.]
MMRFVMHWTGFLPLRLGALLATTISPGSNKDSGQLGRAGRYFEALHFCQICYLIVSGYAGRAGDGAGGDSSAAPRQEAILKSCLKASGFLGVSDTGAPITRAGVSMAG